MELLSFTLPTGAKMTAWLHCDSPELVEPHCFRRTAVVVCPGGAYQMISGREKDPTAAEFFAMGAQVFVLEYSVQDAACDKRPLEELARTVLMVRQNAEAWRVDPNKVVVIGFSAGGHLAASLGVHWDDPEILARCGVADAKLLRPDGMMLCYPVLTMIDELTHALTKKNVMAGTKEPEEYWSLETQVKDTTPPTFLWHTMEDASVPVENSLMFLTAMHRAGVSCEAHFFPYGGHGISMCTWEVDCVDSHGRQWMGLCRKWLDVHFGPVIGA